MEQKMYYTAQEIAQMLGISQGRHTRFSGK